MINNKNDKIMRKIFLISIKAILILSLFSFVGCDKDGNSDNDNGGNNNPNVTIADPEGTITANISADRDIIIYYNDKWSYYANFIGWIAPDNFYLKAEHLTDIGDSGFKDKMSICNLGKMNGLGNIKTIPQNGFTIPRQSNSSIACETGHGYVIKIENEYNSMCEYVRLYVVEPIISTYGGIMGAKVKYQYPFEP